MTKEEIIQIPTPAPSAGVQGGAGLPRGLEGAQRETAGEEIYPGLEVVLENYDGSSASIEEEIVYPVIDYLHKLSYPCRLVDKTFADPLRWVEVVKCYSDVVVVRRKVYDDRYDKPLVSYIVYLNAEKGYVFVPQEVKNMPISLVVQRS